MALATNALTTLSAAKNYLKIAAGDTSRDELLEELISALSLAMENHIGRAIIRRQIVDEPHEGSGRVLQLENYPVTEFAVLLEDGETVPADKYEVIKASGLVLGKRAFRGTLLASYSAGYADTAQNAPRDVQLALWKWLYASLYTEDGVERETLGDYSVQYYGFAEGMPRDTMRLLEPYRTRTV